MIGYNITVSSNTSFSRNYGEWTEGDFWISDAVSVMSKIPGLKLAGKVIGMGAKSKGAIEAGLKGFLNGYLVKLANVGNKIGVCVQGKGNTFFNYSLFNIDCEGDVMVARFIYGLQNTSQVYGQELGTQVMIQICRAIVDFDTHLAASGTLGQLWIEIEF
jgi:hypothetical protein